MRERVGQWRGHRSARILAGRSRGILPRLKEPISEPFVTISSEAGLPALSLSKSFVTGPQGCGRYKRSLHSLENKMVGAVRFELTTSCTRNKRASQATLRPDKGSKRCRLRISIATKIFLLSTIAGPWSFARIEFQFTNYKLPVSTVSREGKSSASSGLGGFHSRSDS